MREIRTSGLMSEMWKRSMVELVRHPQTKGRGTDRLDLNHRATSRLYAIHEEASVKTKEQDEHGTSQTSIRHHPRCGAP
jgi:hypothetical protein